MFSVLLFAISSILSELFDYYDFLIPIIIAIAFFAISFAVLLVIYLKSSNIIAVDDNEIVIYFGYKEMNRGGYADIKTKINADEIRDCTLETKYEKLDSFKFFMLRYDNKTYNERRIEIINGNYDEPFVKLVLKNDSTLYLPVKNAAELCECINMICK